MPKFYAFLLCFLCLNGFSQNTILWEVKDTLHHKTSYLLGTYHQLGNHFADGHPVIAEKLLGSEVAIFESLSEVDIAAIILARPSSQEYRKSLGKKYANLLDELAENWKYPPEKLRPEEIQVKLYQSYYKTHCGNVLATDSFDHFDEYLTHLARNEAWMAILPEKLRTQNCFVAVGLLHLYHDCGLIEQLRKLGFQVNEVKMKSGG